MNFMSEEERKAKLKEAVFEDGTIIDFKTLYYEFFQATDSDIIEVLNETDSEKVKIINLKYCKEITDETVYVIAQNCQNLEEINLARTSLGPSYCFTDDSLVALAERCPLLKLINLYNCKNLTDKTVYSIAKNCPNLEWINLDFCDKITTKGVQHLCEYCVDGATLLLPNLKSLRLSGCGLASLPEIIGNLASLKYLDIRHNQLTKLPHTITQLSPVGIIDVDDNPLQEPPLEIAKQGLSAILRYFEKLDQGRSISTQLKVVLVGNGGAGKTSLRNAMAGRVPAHTPDMPESTTVYLVQERISAQEEEDKSHPLADILLFERLPLLPEPPTNHPLKDIMLYDCGGQEDYAMSQARPFLTQSSLFILVVSVDKANDDKYHDAVERFLVLLQARAPGAVVQLVLSKIDRDKEGYENKERWLKEKVNTILTQWKNAAAEKRRDNGSGTEDTRTEAKPLLTVLPEVLCVSAKDDPHYCKAIVYSAIFEVSKPNGMFPTVGQAIPDIWVSLWKLLGSVLLNGADFSEQKLFEAAQSVDSRPVNSLADTTAVARGSYCRLDTLRELWNRFCTTVEDVKADPKDFDDALGLLDAQGDVFTHGELAFLKPSFVTDLMRPLVDHTLPEKIELPAYRECIRSFVKEHGEITGIQLLDGLTKLVRTGELHQVVLPFLWREFNLDPADFERVVQMFIDATVIFPSRTISSESPDSRDVSGSQNDITVEYHPVVLYRLPPEPQPAGILENVWPEELRDGEQQIELRVQLYTGCPTILAARFAAAAHHHGYCRFAWLTGAIVEMDGSRIKADCRRTNGNGLVSAELIFTVRGRRLGRETWALLKKTACFVEREKSPNHLPGLHVDIFLIDRQCSVPQRVDGLNMPKMALTKGTILCDKCAGGTGSPLEVDSIEANESSTEVGDEGWENVQIKQFLMGFEEKIMERFDEARSDRKSHAEQAEKGRQGIAKQASEDRKRYAEEARDDHKRIEDKVDIMLFKLGSLEAGLGRIETTVIGLANEEQKYPHMFYLFSVPTKIKDWRSWLTLPDKFLNRKLMVVFFCARTKKWVKYGDKDGLEFSAPRNLTKRALDFWLRYGPIIKFSATLLSIAVKATTNVNLGDLIPPFISKSLSTLEEAKDFVENYADMVGEAADAVLTAADAERSTMSSIQPATAPAGALDLPKGELQDVVGTAYIEFGKLLESVGFEKEKLNPPKGMTVMPVDGRLQFVTSP